MSQHGPTVPPEPRYTGHVKTVYVGGPRDGEENGFSCCPGDQLNGAGTRIEYRCDGCDNTQATLVYLPPDDMQETVRRRLALMESGDFNTFEDVFGEPP